MIEAMGDAHVNIVIQGGHVGLDVSHDVPLLLKFERELTEAHRAEIIAVFGPGDHYLDWEFLQDFVRPAVTDKLSRFWPDNIDTKTRELGALEQLWEMLELNAITDEQFWEMFADIMPPLPPKPAGVKR
jgi:hypothetical protein